MDDKYLHIIAKETVTRSVTLEIGVDISKEKAQQLIEFTEERVNTEEDGYAELDNLLSDETYVENGFFDIQIYSDNSEE